MTKYGEKLGDPDQIKINKDLSWTKTHVQFFSRSSKVYYLHNPANNQIKKEKHIKQHTHSHLLKNQTLIID